MNIEKVAAELAWAVVPGMITWPGQLSQRRVAAERIIRDRLRAELEPTQHYAIISYEHGAPGVELIGTATVRKVTR